MTVHEPLSVGLVIAVAVLVGVILGLHLYSFRCKAPLQRIAYFLITCALLVGTLFFTILEGDEKIASVSVGQAYGILLIPAFYRMSPGDLATSIIVLGIPLIHNLTCIFLASIIVHVIRKTEQQ